MTDWVFLHKAWMLPVMIGAVLLLLLFLWKEWTTTGRKRMVLKSWVSLIAIAALMMLALKPAAPLPYEAEKTILLTEGYEQQHLDSLQELMPKVKVEQYEPGVPLKEELRLKSEVLLLGNGLETFDLWQLEEVPVEYLKGKAPKGLVRINYPEKGTAGDFWNFKGHYAKPVEGNRLILQGPGGTALDSVVLIGEESQTFRLSTELLVEGNYLFSIVEKDSLREVLRKDPIPLQVDPSRSLKILIVNAFPSFETKYLKNYLAEAGHEVVVRSQITRGRFKYEYFNTERVPIGSLEEEQLKDFDLLVIDAGSLPALTRERVASLEKAVRSSGLGVFIQPDQRFFASQHALRPFEFVPHAGTEVNHEGTELSKAAFSFENLPGLEVIHNSEGGIYSAYKRMGSGRIGSSVFENTYQLVLEGKGKAYKKIWTELLDRLAKEASDKAVWEPINSMAFADKPFRFRLRTALADPRVMEAQELLPLKRDVALQDVWEGTTWPRESGWQRQVLKNDTTATFEYYVMDSSHWNALVAQQTINENRRYFMDRKLELEELSVLEPISPIWFYCIFLGALSFLWFEPKFLT